jgi:hypothetical protein
MVSFRYFNGFPVVNWLALKIVQSRFAARTSYNENGSDFQILLQIAVIFNHYCRLQNNCPTVFNGFLHQFTTRASLKTVERSQLFCNAQNYGLLARFTDSGRDFVVYFLF